MRSEGITKEVLEYLKKEGSTNTFKMARTMGLERNMLLNVIRRLEKKEAVKCERGNVMFLKFPTVEPLVNLVKKPAKMISSQSEQQKINTAATSKKAVTKKAVPAAARKQKVVSRKPAPPEVLLQLQAENKQLQQKVWQLGESIKELEQKASAAPKTITKTVTRTIIKKVPVTKTVIKKVPVIKTVVRRIPEKTEKIPVPAAPAETKVWDQTRVWEQLKDYSEQFKHSGLTLLENIKQLREPEFVGCQK